MTRAQQFKLVMTHGERVVWDRELPNTTSVIGRDRSCEVRVPIPSVSRRHARISWKNGKAIVTDLNSSTGTFQNGVLIERAELRHGDILQVGPVTFTVHIGDAVMQPPAQIEILPSQKIENQSSSSSRID